MPTIYSYVETEVDVEIDVVEFVDSCDQEEINSLIEYLTEEGHLSNKIKDESKMTSTESEFNQQLALLSEKFYQMTKEETDLIESLYNKYR